MTEEERAQWEERMKKGRGKGMEYLPLANEEPGRNWDNCAICDAAAGACSRDGSNTESNEEATD